MITANVIHRVFHICHGASLGTAFVINVDDREYIVTARHVVASISEVSSLGLFSNGEWTTLPVSLVGHCEGDIDISVLSTHRSPVPPSLPLEPTSKGLVYGQDVYFLGFPYGLVGEFILGPNGYPLPFVKRATLSLFNGPVFFLDGHNNPGFSGGPVVFAESPGSELRLAGVISGYRATSEPVYEDETATGMTFKYNTGIIVAYSIDSALNVIHANQIAAE